MRNAPDHPLRCKVEACNSDTFFDGLCCLHGMQKYYREAGAERGVPLTSIPCLPKMQADDTGEAG
jgi:hypothetical protein